jgi:aminoglycoside phosphotransferase family enzyme
MWRSFLVCRPGSAGLGALGGLLATLVDVGLGKETLGTVLGNERLEEAGEAQQDRAKEQLKALRAEVRAQKAEAQADAQEGRQKAAQRAKAS